MSFKAVSNIRKEKYTLYWTINNYKTFIWNKDLQQMESPIFFSVGKSLCDWQLRLVKKKIDIFKEIDLELNLKLVSSSKVKEMEISQIWFSISDNDHKVFKMHTIDSILLKIGEGPIFTLSTLTPILFSTINISCTITYSVNVISSIIQAPKFIEEIPNTILADFKSLLEYKDSSDVKLITQGKEFKVHKIILSARSPVFSAMFQHDMKEQQMNEVEINDVAPDVLKEMLHFIYTDEVNNIKEMAGDLLVLAEKYDIKGLKVKCEIALQEALTIYNVFETLNLACLHNAQDLKNYTLNFTKEFGKDIVETPEFKALEHSEPSVVLEMFRFIATN